MQNRSEKWKCSNKKKRINRRNHPNDYEKKYIKKNTREKFIIHLIQTETARHKTYTSSKRNMQQEGIINS